MKRQLQGFGIFFSTVSTLDSFVLAYAYPYLTQSCYTKMNEAARGYYKYSFSNFINTLKSLGSNKLRLIGIIAKYH